MVCKSSMDFFHPGGGRGKSNGGRSGNGKRESKGDTRGKRRRRELRKGRKKGERARSGREMRRRWMMGGREERRRGKRAYGGRGWEAAERNARRSRLRLIGKKIALARR